MYLAGGNGTLYALEDNTTGASNTAIGFEALYQVNGGDNNTAIGDGAEKNLKNLRRSRGPFFDVPGTCPETLPAAKLNSRPAPFSAPAWTPPGPIKAAKLFPDQTPY